MSPRPAPGAPVLLLGVSAAHGTPTATRAAATAYRRPWPVVTVGRSTIETHPANVVPVSRLLPLAPTGCTR